MTIDRVAPEELVERARIHADGLESGIVQNVLVDSGDVALIRDLAQHISRLEGENERRKQLTFGCLDLLRQGIDWLMDPPEDDEGYRALDRWLESARTALTTSSHSAPKEGT